jgi:hypothetical protein
MQQKPNEGGAEEEAEDEGAEMGGEMCQLSSQLQALHPRPPHPSQAPTLAKTPLQECGGGVEVRREADQEVDQEAEVEVAERGLKESE